MTAASGADQPTLREQFAEELGRHQALLGPMDNARPDVWQARCECGWDGGDHAPDWKRRYRQHVADALLPLIEADRERAKAEGGAEALETCYREDRTTVAKLNPIEQLTCFVVKTEDMVMRAVALRGSTGGGT